MFKWLGVLLIVFGTSMTGFEMYSDRKKSKMCTEAFLKALTFMRDEMRFSKAYIENVFTKCMEADHMTESFFIKLSEGLKSEKKLDLLWCEAVSETEYLCENAKKSISELSNILGVVDLEAQSNHIDRCIGELETILKDQSEQLSKKGTMYPKVGFLSGILLAILLF